MNNLFEVLYYINSNENLSQRDISTQVNLSLGMVNKTIAQAIDLNLLTGNSTYSLTKKGLDFLQGNSVDNAIIMAAGFGSRFVPLTYETPKGLVEVLGVRMIERQIIQLHEAGITDISIVVGYLKEKFEYLTDKYGVKLIFNPDYSIKNNISSLYYAKKELKNTYILTSDIYMPNNLYREYEAYSYYIAEFFDDSQGEWALKLNRQNLITGVNPNGDKDVWAMYGPSFFTKDFSEKLVKLIDHYYDLPTSAQWYWEDVYINHIDTLDMYARKVEKGSVHEFESIEELRQFDKSYLVSSGSEVLDTIANVFDVTLDKIIEISTLKEGMTNDSFVFSVNECKYVFRVPGKGTDLLLNRLQESNVYDVIRPLKISDEIIYLDPSKGYKITKFLEDSHTLDASDEKQVRKSMDIIRSLHNNGLEVEHEFDIEERIGFYKELCAQSNAVLFNDYDYVSLLIDKLLELRRSKVRPQSLCHIDSIPANFLIHGEEMYLLDWEYAGMADPFIDIAMFCIYEGFQDEQITGLLGIYLERTPTDEEVEIVHTYVALSGFLWALWTQYKQAQGEDFGTYGMEQYRYARKYARTVLEKEL